MLLSSELLGLTKALHLLSNPLPPAAGTWGLIDEQLYPEIYRKALKFMRLDPEECVMVAAHAYDLRAVKKVASELERGRHGIEAHEEQWNEGSLYLAGDGDLGEDMDLFIYGTRGGVQIGLGDLADIWTGVLLNTRI